VTLLCAIGLLLTTLGAPAPSLCTCAIIGASPSIGEYASQSDMVFGGTALSQTTIDTGAVGKRGLQTFFIVDAVWVGEHVDTVTIHVSSPMCNGHFAVGHSYLVFASRVDGQLQVTACASGPTVGLDMTARDARYTRYAAAVLDTLGTPAWKASPDALRGFERSAAIPAEKVKTYFHLERDRSITTPFEIEIVETGEIKAANANGYVVFEGLEQRIYRVRVHHASGAMEDHYVLPSCERNFGEVCAGVRTIVPGSRQWREAI
jgi:hypothetical protein